ncbi:uncharacterized protein LOC143817741 [Ranitomeya variabilis]|uniref:uncharacterized protein LOC143817741 n=1 Tax=Ranitomeya variabilis TaxID=490064 RepID=UPI0040561CFF
MSDSNAGSSFRHNPRKRVCRFTSDEIMRMLEESDSEHEDEPYVASDDENYVPQVDVTEEDSDIEQEMVIEHENEYESDESVEDDSVPQSAGDIWTAKDETQWCSNPLPNAQTKSRNVLRQRGGPAAISNLYTAKELFKSIMTPEMSDFQHKSDLCHLQKFSDDSVIVGDIVGDRGEEEYRRVVSDFVNWCQTNCLELNVKKIKEMVVSYRKKKEDYLPITIVGQEVEIVESYKYLEVHLDSKLD